MLIPTHPLPDSVLDDCHVLIRRAVDYWLSIHPAEGLPGRQHFDPIDIAELLPYTSLIEVAGEPPQFKARLVGTAQAQFYDRDFTGHRFHELFTDFSRSPTGMAFLATIRTRQPNWRKGAPTLFHKKDYHEIERVMLPLATNGGDIDMLFIVHTFEKADGPTRG